MSTNAAAPAATPAPFQVPASPAGFGGAFGAMNFAPDNLWQKINPWFNDWSGNQIGFINIDFGQTQHPDLERKILDEVGTYGRQLGHLGDVVEVLMGLVDRSVLSDKQRDMFAILEGELAKIREVKRGHFEG